MRTQHVPSPETPVSPIAEELMAEGLMTIEEAVAFSGLSRSTLYTLMNEGKLPYVKVASARRIPRVALKRTLAAGLITK